ncbi:hypothetical protein UPYG_G00112100 [Umbra pygmaea]|uniref:HIRA interacting protein 3 n=1 Tax=Umbra pygmaea TaxID=75934 RepID=A0ABD0X328_UMBPY
MVSTEETRIQSFVCGQLRDCPDLGTLTIGDLRRRYLACVGRDSLTQEERQLMKAVVKDELLKMQDCDISENDNILCLPRKRKRDEKEIKNEKGSPNAVASKAKKTRLLLAPLDRGIEEVVKDERQRGQEEEKDKTNSELTSEKEEQISKMGKKEMKEGCKKSSVEASSESKVKTKTANNKMTKQQQSDKESEEEDFEESELERQDCSNSDSEEETKWKRSTGGKEYVSLEEVQNKCSKGNWKREHGHLKNKGEALQSKGGSNASDLESNRKAEIVEQNPFNRQRIDNSDSSSRTVRKKNDSGASSEKARGEDAGISSKTQNENVQDSDSSGSSLPSLEDEQKSEKDRKKRTVAKQARKKYIGSKGETNDKDPAVARLKRYILLCGVRRNYKKLLEGCRSVKSKVNMLKTELDNLGVKGLGDVY